MDTEFLALGLGGTNMMAMLWSVAEGKRAVGVDMRGDPLLGVHWNLRVDFFHHLGLLDRMMMERYGSDGIPRHSDGSTFRLAERFFGPDTMAGHVTPDNIIGKYDRVLHLAGRITQVDFIDDRWRDGKPQRVLTALDPVPAPLEPDPSAIRTDVHDVLDGPSTFQAEAASVLRLLRRYLEAIEAMDVAAGSATPRVRLFTNHRAVDLYEDPDGRIGVRIEELQEFDHRGRFVRVRKPGTDVLDLGVPELLAIAQGFDSSDAKRLGFRQHDVAIDHGDGRGPVVAQADFLAGLLQILVDGRLRRRIASCFDPAGQEYWLRQLAVGHENDPEVGWVVVQVPDFMVFDPIEHGLVAEGTDPESPEFHGAYRHLLYEFYIGEAAAILGVPVERLRKVQMPYGPKLFSLVERVGDTPLVAPNTVVAGDSFGNGHFLTSGGAMTGILGHGSRVLEYWRARNRGDGTAAAIGELADGIRADTQAWLDVSALEYRSAAPINFGAERIATIAAASGIAADATATTIDAARRRRHTLLPLDASDWRRPIVRNGLVSSEPLPPLSALP